MAQGFDPSGLLWHTAQALGMVKATPGAMAILQERLRQVLDEKWTSEHDDEHDSGELSLAAECYVMASRLPNPAAANPPANWPWHSDWWKPSEDPIRNLEKAGALIAAEIDRLKRREQ